MRSHILSQITHQYFLIIQYLFENPEHNIKLKSICLVLVIIWPMWLYFRGTVAHKQRGISHSHNSYNHWTSHRAACRGGSVHIHIHTHGYRRVLLRANIMSSYSISLYWAVPQPRIVFCLDIKSFKRHSHHEKLHRNPHYVFLKGL